MTIHYRQDYRPFDWTVHQVELCFDLDAQSTRVQSRMHLSRKQSISRQEINREAHHSLVLDGEDLELESIRVDRQLLDASRYQLKDNHLILHDLPNELWLETVVRIKPAENSSLSGLYQSGQNLLTQCEAEGFRRISFFPDRPDVMTRYTVRLRADPNHYPGLS